MNEELKARLAEARRAWLEVMGEYRSGPGMVNMPPTRSLGEEHIANCTVLASREHILHRMPTGSVAAEVGVMNGRFSQRIWDIVHPTALHLFDTNFTEHAVDKRFAPQIADGSIHLHEGLSWDRLPELPDRSLDFIYIDADHSYEGVKRDVEIAKGKIKPDGFLLFNDYTYWSPLECIKYGVVEAVNELCVDEGWRIVYFALSSRLYCDVAIRRIGS